MLENKENLNLMLNFNDFEKVDNRQIYMRSVNNIM